MQLRSYQQEAITRCWEYMYANPGKYPVIAMPTGTGKSLVIAGFAQQALKQWANTKIVVATHVKELIVQNYSKLMTLWPFAPAGIYSAGLKQRDARAQVVFAGIQSAANSWAAFGFVHVLLIDEAHLLSPGDATNYQKFIAGLKSINPHLVVIGLTATPYRLGHGHICEPDKDGKKALFDDVCFDITGLEPFNRLIAEGYLAPLIPKPMTTELDIHGVKKTAGDYNLAALQVAVNKDTVTRAALEEALRLAHDRKHWLIFASGVEHSDSIARVMNELGETCLSVHSKMGDEARDTAIRRFQAGEVRALVNNNVLTTGFDSPWIDCIVGLRPTTSAVLHVQMMGRGTRPFSGNEVDPRVKENCLVLDFAGNTRKLGPINDPVVPRKKGEGGGEAPIKVCEVCNTMNHASVRVCILCGAEFQFAVKIKQEAETTDLIKGELPKTAVFKVDQITYTVHRKTGRPPSLKVTYYCGLKSFNEWVLFEHAGFGAVKAARWWRTRTDLPVPKLTAEALELLDGMTAATHIRVWLNATGGHPEILAYCFDGTAFNTEAPSEGPEVFTDKEREPIAPSSKQTRDYDDDIPF